MGFQVAAAVPSPCAHSSASSATSTSSRSPFLGGRARLASSGGGLLARRRGSEAQPARCALSASIDGTGGGDTEFLRRIEELAASAGVRTAGCGWPPSLERSVGGVGLPLSLRMLKRKKKQQQAAPRSRWDERLLGLGSAGESVGRAFSSMVLIVRELQSFALRQMQLGDDLRLQAVLARARGETHDSLVWLFQHIFAGTPALMLSLMLLLADFTVHSMSHSLADAVPPSPPSAAAAAASVVDAEPSNPRFDAGAVKTFSVGRTASVGGGSGGGGDARPVAGAPGDDHESRYSLGRVAPQQLAPLAGTGAEKVLLPDAAAEDEQAVWERMVAEASRLQANARAEELSDPEVLGNLVAPVVAEVETEDLAEYARTEQRYELAVAEEPGNSLILANFAQFLYLTRNDHKRAEHYFERAEPTDAEALSRYATFLWKARDDVAAAEETYQEAIAADPGNAHYAAAYAHFLWNTGGDETCYPLD